MKLKELIDEKCMVSTCELSRQTGVCRQTIGNIMNGKGKPSRVTVKKICRYFGVDFKDYLE